MSPRRHMGLIHQNIIEGEIFTSNQQFNPEKSITTRAQTQRFRAHPLNSTTYLYKKFMRIRSRMKKRQAIPVLKNTHCRLYNQK